jgi:hypothetical protein
VSAAAAPATAPARDDWLTRLRAPGSARHLALVRIVFAAHVLTVLLSPAVRLMQQLGAVPQPLTHTVVPAALERWLARGAVLAVLDVGVVAALCVLLGALTRLALPVLLACFLLTQNYWYRDVNFHDDWLYLTFDLLVLCFAPCADALALDALVRRRAGRRPASRDAQAYRWPVEAMIGWVSLLYVAAGLAKLLPLRKGLVWLTGISAQRFAQEFLADSPVHWLLRRPAFDYGVRWPFTLAAWGTVLVELGAAALLVTRRAYVPVLLGLLGMHAAIYMLGIPGFVQIALASCVLFLRPESFRDFGRVPGAPAPANAITPEGDSSDPPRPAPPASSPAPGAAARA